MNPTRLQEARLRLINGTYDPLAHRCTCGAPRNVHGGAKHTGGHADTKCARYRADVVDELLDRVMAASGSSFLADVAAYHRRAFPRPTPRPGGWSVGPSDYGRCGREIQLRERPPEGFVPEPVDDAATTAGTMFHDQLRRARESLYPWRLYEQSITIPGMDRPGRYDEFDPVLAEVMDLKSKGSWGWERLGKVGPDPKDWGQLSIYGYALRAAGMPVDRMRLLYVNRETLEDEQFVAPYNEAAARAALGRLRALNIALDAGQDLPRDPHRSGPSSDPLCARCPFRRACWNMDAAEEAGRSPESWTILGPDPQVAEIEWAAAQVLEAKEAKSTAEKDDEDRKVLLEGIAPGTYGGMEVIARSRKMPDWKGWALKVQAARQLYEELPPHQRGDFADWVADIEVPKRTDTWVEVKRVRAHDRPTTPRGEAA